MKSFLGKDSERLFNDYDEKKIRGITGKARIKLEILNATVSLDGLRLPPGNRLEALKGDRKGQYSIRIDSQWRVCFRWIDGNAHDVPIVDYHEGNE
jgi:proteic killer suppression protein